MEGEFSNANIIEPSFKLTNESSVKDNLLN